MKRLWEGPGGGREVLLVAYPLILLGLLMVRRFRAGRWKSLRIIEAAAILDSQSTSAVASRP